MAKKWSKNDPLVVGWEGGEEEAEGNEEEAVPAEPSVIGSMEVESETGGENEPQAIGPTPLPTLNFFFEGGSGPRALGPKKN